jgi:hypothetical protein
MMTHGVMPTHSLSTLTIMPVGTLWTAMALALGAVGGSGLGSGVVAQAASARLARNVVVFIARPTLRSDQRPWWAPS